MSKKEKKNKIQRKAKRSLQSAIVKYLENNPNESFNVKQLSYRLGFKNKKDRAVLQNLIQRLVEDGVIAEPNPWKYKAKSIKKTVFTGKIEITKFGYAFVSCDEFEDDIFIPPRHTATAFNGDNVEILIQQTRKGKKIEGHVTRIIERSKTDFVGIVELSSKFAFVVPDSNKSHIDFFVPLTKLAGAKNGEKVIVQFVDWPKGSKNPFGKIKKVLGKAGENEVEMHAIIEEFGLPYKFPKNILQDAEAISDAISENEIKKRKDLRKILTFTIDPHDAKDFDDAISFRKINDKKYEIGIHIADVTHYLKQGTDLDKEAFKRATSVYLVDRVIPMLPERLSNNLCSLRPDEDKLCFSAIFEMDDKAVIHKEWFGKTIIRSDKRFAYEDVQKIIEDKKGKFAEEILKINAIATKLREQRYADGSFSFETEEVEFDLDKKGNPLGILKKLRKEANMLIEDFMLLANRKVASIITNNEDEIPFVYRNHESPKRDRLEQFIIIVQQFGYQIDNSNKKVLAQSFNELLKRIEGKPEQNFLQTLAIKSMSKAEYSAENIGHFGLSFENYTHFTSPIRRYPDVMVHRLLNDYLSKNESKASIEELEDKCKHSSEREINAEASERASIKYKQVEYMKDRLGETFKGVISGIIQSGFFVELIESKCEGFVPIQSIKDDFYIYDEDNYQFTGYTTKKRFKLGQSLKVKVVEANLIKRELTFGEGENISSK
ncbi:MAG: ribonuclease R [Bacteroidota bacterium]|nr:ribonuclease R [Bacteroidota bacterium]